MTPTVVVLGCKPVTTAVRIVDDMGDADVDLAALGEDTTAPVVSAAPSPEDGDDIRRSVRGCPGDGGGA